MLHVKAFFLFGACSIHLQTNLFHSTHSKYHTDAVHMQKIHNFCKKEKENGLTISLKEFNQGKSTIERLMKRHQTKEEEPERSGTKGGPTGRP